MPPDYFCEQLQRHLDPELRLRKPPRKKLRGLEPSYDVLKKLEVALRTNTSSWIEEFLDHPNSGHLLIIAFMRDLPEAAHNKSNNPLLGRQPVGQLVCHVSICPLFLYPLPPLLPQQN